LERKTVRPTEALQKSGAIGLIDPSIVGKSYILVISYYKVYSLHVLL